MGAGACPFCPSDKVSQAADLRAKADQASSEASGQWDALQKGWSDHVATIRTKAASVSLAKILPLGIVIRWAGRAAV